MKRKILLAAALCAVVAVAAGAFLYIKAPESLESRAARYEQLLVKYPYYKVGMPIMADYLYFPTLEGYIDYYDVCAVIEVTKGMDNTEPLVIEGEDLFGEGEEETIKQYKEDGLFIAHATYSPYEAKVTEYIINKTEMSPENILIMYGLLFQDYGIQAREGMKIIMFLSPNNFGENTFYGISVWAFFITDDGYIMPAVNEEPIKEYGGMKLDDYIKYIKEVYKSAK